MKDLRRFTLSKS